MKSSLSLLAGIFLELIAGPFTGCTDSRGTRQPPPRLTIVLVIDQFRYDYMQRFAGYWQRGMAKLLREGASFSQAHHEHAITACAPGHATLLTGSHPARHGIVGERWYDRARQTIVGCVEDTAYATVPTRTLTGSPHFASGKSPLLLQSSTLGEWLKSSDPQAKVLSISGQDHAAILMAGRHAEAAYWFDTSTGTFVSSTYYLKQMPPAVSAWNARHYAERYRGAVWEKSLPETAYFSSREDLFATEADGMHTTFPHRLDELNAGADTSFHGQLMASPFGDLLTLEFAQIAIRAHELGQDLHPDLLCLSLSATEGIGRAFGPLSQEIQDHLLRLDACLENFFAWLEANIGLQNCCIVLTADHGVLPMPEELRRRGFEAARLNEEEMRQEIVNILQDQAVAHTEAQADSLFVCMLNGVYLSEDTTAVESSPTPIPLPQLAEKLQALSFVTKVFTASTLAAQDQQAEDFIARFRHSYFAGRSPEVLWHRKPFFLLGGQGPYGTDHGSEFDYDTHVPMVFWGPAFRAGKYEEKVATVDLAPTLAAALSISISHPVDGKVLQQALKTP